MIHQSIIHFSGVNIEKHPLINNSIGKYCLHLQSIGNWIDVILCQITTQLFWLMNSPRNSFHVFLIGVLSVIAEYLPSATIY